MARVRVIQNAFKSDKIWHMRHRTLKMLHSPDRLPLRCRLPNCAEPVIAKYLCKKHYGRLQARLYREKHPEYVKRQGRRATGWYAKLKESNPAKIQQNLDKTKQWREKLKDDVFLAYGGYRCACCGITGKVFLGLDHVNGGGCRERRLGKIGVYSIYSKLRKEGFPPGYQVLCMNCNFAKGQLGSCPHKKYENGPC